MDYQEILESAAQIAVNRDVATATYNFAIGDHGTLAKSAGVSVTQYARDLSNRPEVDLAERTIPIYVATAEAYKKSHRRSVVPWSVFVNNRNKKNRTTIISSYEPVRRVVRERIPPTHDADPMDFAARSDFYEEKFIRSVEAAKRDMSRALKWRSEVLLNRPVNREAIIRISSAVEFISDAVEIVGQETGDFADA